MATSEHRARLNCQIAGPEDAPVVVLGPSLGTDLGLFDSQTAALEGKYRVIRYDLRGHGNSEVPQGPYTIQAMAEDVLALLDELGVRRFSYVGVSIGGAIAQWIGVHHGDRLDGLVIIASAAQFYDPPSWSERAKKVLAEGTGFLVPSRTGAWFTEEFAEQQPEAAEWLLRMLRTTPREGYAGCCEAIGEYDLRGQLHKVTAPTLVISGEEDPATPVETCRAIADGIPGAELLVVAGVSHLLNVEAPDVTNAAIVRHLDIANRIGTESTKQ